LVCVDGSDRAAHPLYTLSQAHRVPDFVNCLIRMANESPEGMPVWPLQGKETGTVTGYHSAAVIAEACVKKFPNLDLAKAYPAMKKRAMVDDYRSLGLYRKLGYIPADKEEESVSKTMEYVYDHWAVAHVAEALSQAGDATLLLERSKSYRNLFEPESRFIRARLENREWAKPFDPRGIGRSKQWRDYTEANSGRPPLRFSMTQRDTSICSAVQKPFCKNSMNCSPRVLSFPLTHRRISRG
jgi:putative alpha-1,2-mannosidase